MTITISLRLLSLALICAGSFALTAPPQAAGSETPTATRTKTRLIEPKLTIAQVEGEGPAVALTFDACMGKVDDRILDTLIENRIPSTVFVTARWLKHNAAAFAVMRANPDLFEIEDHGGNHVPAIDVPMTVFGIKTAGSAEAVAAEVEGGAEAIIAAGGERPVWFRGATAKYTPSAIAEIQSLGYRVAGYSINGDSGSLLGASGVARQYHRAKDGDVIISHINQPTHEAGEGVVKGILDLKARGFRFVRLKDRTEPVSGKSF